MISVEKRDGAIVNFDIQKIQNAIEQAFQSIPLECDPSILDLLALKVTADFQEKIKNGVISVEDIQDSVEKVLSQAGYSQVCKAYILYRKQRENLRELKKNNDKYISIIDSYINDENWRATENSMDSYSVGGLIFSNSGAVTTIYWLHQVYDEEISKAHMNGDIHIHDLDMLTGDSAGWSIAQIIEEGLKGVGRYVQSKPSKHLHTLCSQISNFLSIVQNEWAGAQSLLRFDTYLAPFVKIDQLNYQQVHQIMENFIYGMNMPNRWGTTIPFSNIILDWTIPEELKEQEVVIQNQNQGFTYSQCQEEMNIINEALMDIFLEASGNERGFQFPIPTIRIQKDFDFEHGKHTQKLFELSAKYGLPHFENAKKNTDTIRHTKDFLFDENQLIKKAGGYFGYGENMGSIGSVTINLGRIAYFSQNEEEFFSRLQYLLEISARSLHVKRQVLNRFLERGLYPYTKQYLKTLDYHFSTIGIIGMNETCIFANWIQSDLMNEKGLAFAKKIISYIKEQLILFQKQYHEPFNLEATPAEGVSYRFAKLDQEFLKGKLYYTNASNCAVNATNDVFEALDIQETLQKEYTAGTLFNIYLKQRISSSFQAGQFVKTICNNYSIPYFTLTPTYSYCLEHGYLTGQKDICPICSKKTEVYSRVTGYYRCLEEWNDGKKQEYEDRVEFDIE